MNEELKIISASMSGNQLIVITHYRGREYWYPSASIAPPSTGEAISPRKLLAVPHVVVGVARKVGVTVAEVQKAIGLYLHGSTNGGTNNEQR